VVSYFSGLALIELGIPRNWLKRLIKNFTTGTLHLALADPIHSLTELVAGFSRGGGLDILERNGLVVAGIVR